MGIPARTTPFARLLHPFQLVRASRFRPSPTYHRRSSTCPSRIPILIRYFLFGGYLGQLLERPPRTLSNQNLGYLFIRSPDHGEGEYEIMLCATHFLGDGMALHTFMNEFYTLLGSAKSTLDIVDMIEDALPARAALPTPMEDKLPQPSSSLKQAVGAEEYLRSEQRLVGGQGFPRNPKKMERRTVVPTFAYTPEETKAILGACKRNGVTIAHAVFALCNLAWARLTNDKVDPW
jgi:hypothetical protein